MIKTRLIRLLPQAKKHILLAVLWQWGALLTQIVIVTVFAYLMEKGLNQHINKKMIVTALLLFIIMLAIRFICDRRAAKASYRASADVKCVLRQTIYNKLLKLGAAYQERTATSNVVQMAAEGVEQLEVYFGKYLPQLFYSLLAPVTLFIALAFVSIKASVVLLVCVPLIPLSIVFVQKTAKKLLQKYWGAYAGLGDSFLENLQGLATLKIYQTDEYKAAEMDEEARYFRKITMKVLTMQLNSTTVMDIMAYGGAAVGMIVAAAEFFNGRMDLSQALMVIFLASEFFIPLRLLGSFFHIAMNGMAASDRIFELLDLPVEKQGSEILEEENINMVLQKVGFSYEKQRKVLEDINMELLEGQFLSFVGQSGCGKSTLAAILMKRKKQYEGNILVDGVELKELDESEWMKKITLVANNSYLFKGTVADNLRMGKEDASKEEMIEALKQVNLWEYLKGQQGVETLVQEKGENFSGGQCQRLTLARALLKDSPIYIFDEATSNIDVESEEMIMGVIRKLAKRKTVILISHRLANVVESDCIYMLEQGHIVEQGTHEELMEKKGSYQRLFESQQKLEQYGKEQANEA